MADHTFSWFHPSFLRRYTRTQTSLCAKSTNTIKGYFSLNHTRMGPAQDLFGQLWKEYALSDSRYLTSDPFVLCMETVTAVSRPSFSRHLIVKSWTNECWK